MQGALRPSDDAGGCGKVVGRERRILGFNRHGYGAAVPVDLESIRIERVAGDLARDIDEQRVIHIESLAGKREQARKRGQGKK